MKYYLSAFLAVFLIACGILVGYSLFHEAKPAQPKINSETIVSMLRQEGFLITQTYIFSQEVKITKNTGDVFKDFFWGQDITAIGRMKVSSGVDLNKLASNDIKVKDDEVIISLPPVEVHNIELAGEITLQNRQGILKRVFNNDDGYNEAYTLLRAEASKAASASELVLEAEKSTRKEISELLQFLVINRKISIDFKK